MTDKDILAIAEERAFDTATAPPGHGNVIVTSDCIWIGREIEKIVIARANKAFLKVLHLVNNSRVEEATETFTRVLNEKGDN